MTQVSEAPPEPARLAAVRRTALLGAPPEEAFDRLTRLAARLLGTQVALISLVEDDRQFFISATGLSEPLASSRVTPISYSFCRHVVETKARLVVEDARRHPLVRTNPAVRELGWVAYAGVPLTDRDGHILGALSAIDPRPRVWSERDLDLLQDLAAWAVSEIELRARPAGGEPLPIFEETGVAMAIVSADGRILRANNALAELVGTRAGELVGRPIESFTHEDDRPADREALRLLRAGECRSFTAEKRILTETGEPRWVLATTTHLPESVARREQFLVELQESSGRIPAETKTQGRDEEHYRVLVESTHDILWDWDLLTDRIVWAAGARGFLGYGPDELGSSAGWWYERLHPDERERVVASIHRVVAQGERLWSDEHRFRRADGSWAHVEARASVLRDEAGDAVRMVVATLDVTERIRDRQIAECQSRLLEDIAGDVEIGETLRRLVAFTEAHAGAAAAIDLYEPEGEQRRGAGPGAPIPPGASESVFPLVASDGAPMGTLTLFLAPDSPAPDPAIVRIATNLGCIELERDRARAALRRSEDDLRQAQKMEAVGQLAGGIAHDFNNLLTAILSYADLVLEELAEADPIRSDIEQIKHSGHRAAALTRQLLAFSRRQVLQPKVLSLNSAVTDLEEPLRRLAGSGVTLDLARDPALWYIMADPAQLEQVLLNLTTNAREAMPDGGRLLIATSNVTVRADSPERDAGVRPGSYVVLSVTDSGVGMDVATQAQIFEPFFTTGQPGSAGLGLSSVYGIIEQSGGHIAVQSTPGQGTTFRLFLPRHAEPGPASAPQDRRTLPVGSETLLLVEDETAIRSSARRLLERHGYTVVEARHGAEALRVIEESGVRFDLVLTDVVMPEMGGRELVELLRTRDPGLKVLFISGYSERTVTADGTMPPNTGFLEKPFTVEQLLRRLRKVLDD